MNKGNDQECSIKRQEDENYERGREGRREREREREINRCKGQNEK